ncbi:MAG: L,D-transpeptidase [Roseibacillus sp.]|jgi:lipoprotein-anchoring transpeptidase ErfK/SrfK|nr:L,D-transpeptidase [Roseibacillus sp.]MDP6206803.1 L,D-transpeptidase [Roseibacillus sp.]MDP7107476.1 L,D-transpeptidase [Roseibacillus sp.]MDP7308087.1 L,D-transpeptidase [Roseibacillus sp.]MDP7497497.1 L,D-transpeptidase [Roseibacillus sp.]|tara:strand:+ start:7596 stop:8276 length:681 start_codon:yes stop_codon:yes gene_type:complete
MNLPKTLLSALLFAVVAVTTSCTIAPEPNPNQKKILKAQWVNPYPPGSYAYFTAEPSYPKTYNVYKNSTAFSALDEDNIRVEIDLSQQRARIYNRKNIAMDYPIASGRRTFPTPPGNYRIVEKIEREKQSNLYGTIYDAEGKVHKTDADITEDEVPEGGEFKGAAMPYWMRLSWKGLGMHQGRVPRYPASHGCVRMPSKVASTIYSKLPIGTPVSIVRQDVQREEN